MAQRRYGKRIAFSILLQHTCHKTTQVSQQIPYRGRWCRMQLLSVPHHNRRIAQTVRRCQNSYFAGYCEGCKPVSRANEAAVTDGGEAAADRRASHISHIAFSIALTGPTNAKTRRLATSNGANRAPHQRYPLNQAQICTHMLGLRW